jgi:hypothetical protein
MKGFLLDTNVPSEMTRPFPERSVIQWREDADDDQLYLSVITLGEVSQGIATLPESKRSSRLQNGCLKRCGHGFKAGSFRSMDRLLSVGASYPENAN